MTNTSVESIDPASTADRVGQGTAVEQSRAVAEVQSAIIVAQRCPRDLNAARKQMQDSCGQLPFAEKAFFRFPRAGQTISGPSVHLARELARCFGNVQCGLTELRRDDVYGQSEMQAWAWDVQTNTRMSTTFIVPHKRDKRGGPEDLVDMRDIYENNANNGARRLREQIFDILPTWFTEEAIDECNRTLQKGDGKPLEERIPAAIALFAEMGIDAKRLEQKLGRPQADWTVFDLVALRQAHRSIQRYEISIDEEFPQVRASVADLGLVDGGKSKAKTKAGGSPEPEVS